MHFNSYAEGGKVGKPDSIKVDVVIGADGANSRVAKEIDAGELLVRLHTQSAGHWTVLWACTPACHAHARHMNGAALCLDSDISAPLIGFESIYQG